MIQEREVRAILGESRLSPLPWDALSLSQRCLIELEPEKVIVQFELGFSATPLIDTWAHHLESVLSHRLGVKTQVSLRSRIVEHVVQPGLKPLPGIKNLIAVASGKGGVGKSTTALNLALSLQRCGARVGLLDADIYGPNQGSLLQARGLQPVVREGSLHPLSRYGLSTMSLSYLVEEATPMVWRGPMVTKALRQLLFDTQWPELDYLILDLPPGTGDVQLTLAKSIPVAGAVIVTTGEFLALEDARKGIEMFRKVNVPLLGVIENMAQHVCEQCGHESSLFDGGMEDWLKKVELSLLGSIPYARSLQVDGGEPICLREPMGTLAQSYQTTSLSVAAVLARQSRDYSVKFPHVAVIR